MISYALLVCLFDDMSNENIVKNNTEKYQQMKQNDGHVQIILQKCWPGPESAQ